METVSLHLREAAMERVRNNVPCLRPVPMRLAIVGVTLFACLPAAPRATFAQEKTTSATKSDSKSETTSPAAEGVSQEPGAIERMEKGLDAVAKVCVDAVEAVFFYELGKSSKSTEIDLSSTGELDRYKRARAKIVESLKDLKVDPKKKSVLTATHVKKLTEELSFPTVKSFRTTADGEGFNLDECDYTLKISKADLNEGEAADLKQVLNAEFGMTRTRGISVQRVDVDDLAAGKATIAILSHGIPILVLWLVLGATFFTLRMKFINFRGFKHAIKVTAGKYDTRGGHTEGEVNHFQALTAALSATVGLGNIAGVAIAVMAGGPGATFWMIVAGLLGMSAKFAECTLGQKYREVRSDGRIMGGAMFYLSNGLKELKLASFGKALAVLFAVLCVFASFGGGNAFQVNQSLRAVEETIPALKDLHWLYGLIMALMVGVVIIGGIRRIAATAEKIVPLMCGVYILACLWILLMNIAVIPEAIGVIFSEAFTPRAGYGAFLGVLVMGFRRAAFSNEAGVGSAAIAHSAAKTEYPVREGIVALLEPFIDTVVVCTMTALVIVISGAYSNPEYSHYVAANNGAALTSRAMGEQISWFPYVLSIAVILFAYSTMISWSYYGERCWAYLFGDRASMAYRILFLLFVVLGSVVSATNVLALSDLMILGMAFPNILGVLLLSGMVKRDLDDYWTKLKAGEFEQKRE